MAVPNEQSNSAPQARPPKAGPTSPPAAGYPLFFNPTEYMRFREGGYGLGVVKRWFERRVIRRCLKEVVDAHTLCDVPCGPGRLFPVWRKRFSSVVAVDLSDQMVEAAGRHLRALGMDGRALKADVFHLLDSIGGPVDLVASVRFCYYFDRPGRVRLLSALSAASRRYVLVQYKTRQTYKGRRNVRRAARRTNHHLGLKHWCTTDEILSELAEAHLRCLRIAPLGWASDFAFVLAEREA